VLDIPPELGRRIFFLRRLANERLMTETDGHHYRCEESHKIHPNLTFAISQGMSCFTALVLSWSFDVVDHQDFDRTLASF